MSNNNQLANFKNQKNRLQKSSRSFFPKSKQIKLSQTRNETTELGNEPTFEKKRKFVKKKEEKLMI